MPNSTLWLWVLLKGANRMKGVLYEDPHVAVAIEHDLSRVGRWVTVRVANKCSTPMIL